MIMPLEGIRVLEWAMWVSAPMATSCLGDLGAEVIKIEQPGIGDAVRGLMTVEFSLPDGRHALYEAYNRNKRSIVLDLKKEKGKEIAYELVKWADVFVHNFRPDVASELRLDYQTLSQVNPRLIYATASGYGRKGPDRDLRALDMAGFARSGHMAALAGPGDEPQGGVVGVADMMAGFTLSHGILAALLARERLGVAQEIDASLLGSMIYLQHYQVSFALFFNALSPPQSRTISNPLLTWYKCEDGTWLALIMIQGDRYWPDFCRALCIEELEKDPRFEDILKRQGNAAELIAILDRVFATKPREEWMGILRGADLAYCPVNSMLDLPSDPQVVENDYIVDFSHPSLGPVKLTGFPTWFSKTSPSVRRAAPLHGQHTEEVLQEVLGLSWEKIGQLQNEGVI